MLVQSEQTDEMDETDHLVWHYQVRHEYLEMVVMDEIEDSYFFRQVMDEQLQLLYEMVEQLVPLVRIYMHELQEVMVLHELF